MTVIKQVCDRCQRVQEVTSGGAELEHGGWRRCVIGTLTHRDHEWDLCPACVGIVRGYFAPRVVEGQKADKKTVDWVAACAALDRIGLCDVGRTSGDLLQSMIGAGFEIKYAGAKL